MEGEKLYIPEKGDFFFWCDDEYFCIESGEKTGVVNPVGENFYISSFIWNYCGDPQSFHRKATADELHRYGIEEVTQ